MAGRGCSPSPQDMPDALHVLALPVAGWVNRPPDNQIVSPRRATGPPGLEARLGPARARGWPRRDATVASHAVRPLIVNGAPAFGVLVERTSGVPALDVPAQRARLTTRLPEWSPLPLKLSHGRQPLLIFIFQTTNCGSDLVAHLQLVKALTVNGFEPQKGFQGALPPTRVRPTARPRARRSRCRRRRCATSDRPTAWRLTNEQHTETVLT